MKKTLLLVLLITCASVAVYGQTCAGSDELARRAPIPDCGNSGLYREGFCYPCWCLQMTQSQ